MNKPRLSARPLSVLTNALVAESFAKQGFASMELVSRWADIVGAEIAAYAEPIKIQWPRAPEMEQSQPGTLVLRVEGPAALEIQHMAAVVLERVNRFFGWQAVGKLSFRQAPISRRPRKAKRGPDPVRTAQIAETLAAVEDCDLRDALARLGSAVASPIKRT